jgi:3'-phosphoadenosine 5'-phosphosulfate (PAPS) 3'-phosphatase
MNIKRIELTNNDKRRHQIVKQRLDEAFHEISIASVDAENAMRREKKNEDDDSLFTGCMPGSIRLDYRLIGEEENDEKKKKKRRRDQARHR